MAFQLLQILAITFGFVVALAILFIRSAPLIRKAIIVYRQAFCEHDWGKEEKSKLYEGTRKAADDLPIKVTVRRKCKTCFHFIEWEE
jgi:hypothetical protein